MVLPCQNEVMPFPFPLALEARYYGSSDFCETARVTFDRLPSLVQPSTDTGSTQGRWTRLPSSDPASVWTIFKDSEGNLWFGTAVLGVCPYDGTSFKWIPEEELQNGSFGTRSIFKDGRFWFTHTRHRYAIKKNKWGHTTFGRID